MGWQIIWFRPPMTPECFANRPSLRRAHRIDLGAHFTCYSCSYQICGERLAVTHCLLYREQHRFFRVGWGFYFGFYVLRFSLSDPGRCYASFTLLVAEIGNVPVVRLSNQKIEAVRCGIARQRILLALHCSVILCGYF